MWNLDELRGRLVELIYDGVGASISAAFEIVLDAQEAGEPAAWVSAATPLFSPFDAELAGVDLSALAVVRAPSAPSALRISERLLRSGAFGAVALDLGRAPALPQGELGKLVKLARIHDTVVLCLTVSRGGSTSLGSLVSLRVVSSRQRVGPATFGCRLEVLKDKRRGPGWGVERTYCGPPGLR